MQNYKDSSNKLYALDSSEFEHLLPQGCVKITQAETDIFNVPKPPTIDEQNASLKVQLDTIDLKSIRALREGDAVRLKALDDQAKALRIQLK